MLDFPLLPYSSCLKVYLFIVFSYNATERRESSKGGKETNKKAAAPSQTNSKASGAAQKAHTSHNTRRSDAHSTSAPQRNVKASSNSGAQAHDEQVNFS